MDTSNTDDLLDYLKLDPDHHEKIASLIPQVTLDLEVWQQLSIGKKLGITKTAVYSNMVWS